MGMHLRFRTTCGVQWCGPRARGRRGKRVDAQDPSPTPKKTRPYPVPSTLGSLSFAGSLPFDDRGGKSVVLAGSPACTELVSRCLLVSPLFAPEGWRRASVAGTVEVQGSKESEPYLWTLATLPSCRPRPFAAPVYAIRHVYPPVVCPSVSRPKGGVGVSSCVSCTDVPSSVSLLCEQDLSDQPP